MASPMASFVPSIAHSRIGLDVSTAGSAVAIESTGSSAPVAGSTAPDAQRVMVIFNLSLSFLILLCTFASAPHLIARLRQPGAWRQGWLLQNCKVYTARSIVRRSLQLAPAANALMRTPTVKRSLITETAPNPHSSSDSENGHTYPAAVVAPLVAGRRGSPSVPTHIPSWTTLLHPLSTVLSRNFSITPLSVGQILFLGLYATAFLLAAFVNTSGTANLKRSGWLVVGQTPFVVALGSKNSIVGLLLGRGYERLNFFHRCLGKLMFLAALFHVIGYIVLWLKKNTEETNAAKHVSAWVALAGLSLLSLMSLPMLRRSMYNVFYHAHWVGYITYLVAICYHVEEATLWVLATVFVIGLDHICRILKSTYTTVNLEVIPELRTTRIEIPHLTRGWRAGQHVRLRALSTKMGFGSIAEVHPFTIASVSMKSGGQGVVLYVKCAGDWTKRLYDAARSFQIEKGAGFSEKSDAGNFHYLSPSKSYGTALSGMGSGATMKMIVEGPYGGPGHLIASSFTSAFVVAGGSGVTFALSAVDELVRDIGNAQARTRLLHLVWIVQDPGSIFPLLPVLTSLLDRVLYIHTISLKISVYYTRAASHDFHDKLLAIGKLPKGMEVEPGRPNVSDVLRILVQQTASLARGERGLSGLMVGVCGPPSLAEDVRKAVRTVEATLRKSIGGIEIAEE
ncbi:hypothetical protein FRB99_000067 [Tulasnella sp. 403]|nr:hypothetical protein FRB99_000067 [Tulasnella sp. 403]